MNDYQNVLNQLEEFDNQVISEDYEKALDFIFARLIRALSIEIRNNSEVYYEDKIISNTIVYESKYLFNRLNLKNFIYTKLSKEDNKVIFLERINNTPMKMKLTIHQIVIVSLILEFITLDISFLCIEYGGMTFEVLCKVIKTYDDILKSIRLLFNF